MLLDRDELESLTGVRGTCVSIYMPTVLAGRETRQNSIRFKNLLGRAEEELVARTADGKYVKTFLEPAQKLLRDEEFWQRQGSGLAVLLGEGLVRELRTPLAFPELVTVGERLHLKPLFPLINEDGTYYILVLGRKRVRILEANREGARELESNDLPGELRDVVGYDVEQETLQLHTHTGPAGKQAVFHGHGAGKDERNEEVSRFLRAVSRGVRKILMDRSSPVLLAATTETAARFRAENGLSGLLEEGLQGDFSQTGPADLHRQSLGVMVPWFERSREEDKRRYRELSGVDPERTISGLERTVVAAADGRVDTLILAWDEQSWGTFDRSARKVKIHEQREPGDEDLLDLAAVLAFRHGGRVHAVPRDAVPDGKRLVAILRY